MLKIVTLILGLVLSLSLSAQQVRYLKGFPEIPQGSSGLSSLFESSKAVIGNRIIFLAQDRNNNYEIWVTDGSKEGTFKLKDLNRNEPSYPTGFTVLNNRVIFSAEDLATGRELWITDGTVRGTVLLKDIRPGKSSSYPQRLTLLGDKVVFMANDSIHGRELWETDGSSAGTKLLKDINPLGDCYYTDGLVAYEKPFEKVDDKIFFIGYLNKIQDDGIGSLIESDGTSAGTTTLADNMIVYNPLTFLKLAADKIIFATPSLAGNLWVTDHTPTGTQQLSGWLPRDITLLGDKIYFSAQSNVQDRKLWVTDGTVEGTHELSDLPYRAPTNLKVFKNKLYFHAVDDDGPLILSTDGTLTGTKVLNRTSTIDFRHNYQEFHDKVYYPVQSQDAKGSLWASDGENESLVYQFSEQSSIGNLFVYDDQLFFSAFDTKHGGELWHSDGTLLNTALFNDINPGPPSSDPQLVQIVDDKFLFTAHTDEGDEYWISDGTKEGTSSLGDLNRGQYNQPLLQYGLLEGLFENHMLALGDSLRIYLWNRDTESSTLLFDPKASIDFENNIMPTSSHIYFAVQETIESKQLWAYNGLTKAKTKIFEAAFINNLHRVNDQLLFFAVTATENPWKLYTSNGGEAEVLADMNPATPLPLPNAKVSGRFFFLLRNEVIGEINLWVTDGTTVGTKLFLKLPPNTTFVQSINNELLFATISDSKVELWKTNGYTPAIIPLQQISSENQPFVYSNPSNVVLNGKHYLFFYDYHHLTTKLYETDGTPGGTVFITEIPGSIDFNHVVASEQYIFFSNQSEVYGNELWKSDGTKAGTGLVKDISPGTLPSLVNGGPIGVLNGRVYFGALVNTNYFPPDPLYAEMWVSDGSFENTKRLDSNGSEHLRGAFELISLPDRIYLRTNGYQHIGLYEIYEGTSGVDLFFNETKVNQGAQVEWDYTPINQKISAVLTLTNNGDQPLVIANLTFEDHAFTLVEEISGNTIMPGESEVYTVHFASDVAGIYVTDVTITTNAMRDPDFDFHIRAVATASCTVTISSVDNRDEFCANDVKLFKAESVHAGKNPIYDWYAGDQLIASGTTSLMEVPNLTADTDLRAELTPSEDAASTEQSVSSNTIALIIHPVTETIVSITSDITEFPVLSGTLVTFTSTVTAGGVDPDYQWYINDLAIQNETQATFSTSSLKNGDEVSLQVSPHVQCPLQSMVYSNVIANGLVTSIDEIDSHEAILLYPNPTHGDIFIQSQDSIEDVQLVDLNGRVVRYSGRSNRVNTNDLNDGIYILKIVTQSKIVARKITIQH